MLNLSTTCCIAGGGPAGIMLGYLLARAGVEVVVLEKHADFLRDFRGDTVHASTLQLMRELGLLDDFLRRPHQKVNKVAIKTQDQIITMGDLSGLRKNPPYMVMMPQWDFLDFLVTEAKRIDNFKIIMQAEITDVIIEDDKIVGAKAITTDGILHIKSNLLIGADGRHSTVREKANLILEDYGVGIDVLWFRLERFPTDSKETFAALMPGSMMVMINREHYWQSACVIPKGQFVQIQEKGLAAFHEKLVRANPFLKNRVEEIGSWEQVKLLEVQINRLKKWYRPGLLCIGDAAHAMSPVGGVGINLAVQDAVAASRILAKPLLERKLQTGHLAAVQERRECPTKWTQKMQLLMHKNLIYKVIKDDHQFSPPLFLKLVARVPLLSKIIGYIVGVGFRPEHYVSHDL